MLRFLSRFFGFWLVAAALVAAVVDGAKSIAASHLVTTPVAETWTTLAGLLAGSQDTTGELTIAAPWPFDIVLGWLLAAPTVAVLAVLGVLLLVLGAKRRRPSLGREFVT